jgi:hypothetical protein
MASAADESELTEQQLAELSALADGTIDPARRAAVERWVAASPKLTDLYERERGVVEILHQARSTDRAPARLRARIEGQRPSAPVRARRRLVLGGALAGALAALALALVLILPAGTPGSPSVSQAAALALRSPSSPAPKPDPSAPSVKLEEGIDDVYFPNWAGRFGWRAVGERIDHISGRLAVTVYYQWQHKRIAYTIVNAPALATPAARITRLNGTELRTLTLSRRMVVTWRRRDHTCVLSGAGIPAWVLQKLAAWKAPAARS